MNIPENLKYNTSHEWIALADGIATVGITHHAQEELSELVYVELPETGTQVAKGDAIAVVESVKAASDIFAPVTGEIVGGNEDLAADPATLNADPYGAGWIFKIKVADEAEVAALLDAAAYAATIG